MAIEKHFIQGGRPVQELYDTVNYLSGMRSPGSEGNASTIIQDNKTYFTNSVNFNGVVTISGEGSSLKVSDNLTIDELGNITARGNNKFSGNNNFNEKLFINSGNLVANGENSLGGTTTFVTKPTFKIGANFTSDGTSKVEFNPPIEINGKLTAGSASISNLTTSSLNNSETIQTNKIITSDEATFGKDVTCKGNLKVGPLTVSSSNGAINTPGDITGNRVFGSVFNDYAELFLKKGKISAGDIVALDIDAPLEIYRVAKENDKLLVGVCSNQFSYLIGGEPAPEGQSFLEYNLKKYVPIGLAGRVKVKVLAPIKKGDKITISALPGVGKKAEYGDQVVGYALEDYDDDLIVGMVNMKII